MKQYHINKPLICFSYFSDGATISADQEYRSIVTLKIMKFKNIEAQQRIKYSYSQVCNQIGEGSFL